MQLFIHAKNFSPASLRLAIEEKMVGATGFEPATSWTQTTRSSQAELRSDTPPLSRLFAGAQ